MAELDKKLLAIYTDGPDNITSEVNPEAAGARVRAPDAVRGALIALIGNALRHTKPERISDREVRIFVSATPTHVTWAIRNRGRNEDGPLILRRFADIQSSRKLTAVIVCEILCAALYDPILTKMLTGPINISPEWVETRLVFERANSREEHD